MWSDERLTFVVGAETRSYAKKWKGQTDSLSDAGVTMDLKLWQVLASHMGQDTQNLQGSCFLVCSLHLKNKVCSTKTRSVRERLLLSLLRKYMPGVCVVGRWWWGHSLDKDRRNQMSTVFLSGGTIGIWSGARRFWVPQGIWHPRCSCFKCKQCPLPPVIRQPEIPLLISMCPVGGAVALIGSHVSVGARQVT